jgi:hypothetical protein
VKLPLPAFTPSSWNKLRVDVRTAKDNTRAGFETGAAHRTLDIAAREGKPQEVEMQVIGSAATWRGWRGLVKFLLS